jgi:ATP-binding cassette subfamily C protein CydD
MRRDVALLALLGCGTALSIVIAASGLAKALAAFSVSSLAVFVAGLSARAVLTGLSGVVAARMAAVVKAQLRSDLLGAAGRAGPVWLGSQRAGELATLTGRGLDALDGYFTGYLPQLVLGVTVPIAVLTTLAFADFTSALIVLFTLPLIPIFGILIGWQTRVATERQWHRLRLLGGHFLDMVMGLPTLRAFRRAQAQVSAVRDMADRHRGATMKTLRIAFLSALVLELVATVSVALVAVPIGIRLLSGGLTLATALLVLLLTPEAYAPLRTAGTRFHASMEGLTALDQAFTLLAEAPEARAAAKQPFTEIALKGVTVRYDREEALSEVDLTIRAGDRIALVGPSGGGKSTLLALLLGFVSPSAGEVLVDGAPLSTLDISWVPQKPHLFAGTLASNIRLGSSSATAAQVQAAAQAAALPHDLGIVLGERGHGMSSGERQRVAIARAFLRDAPLLLLDEPTARLDRVSEQAVITSTLALTEGKTALMVAHRPAILTAATRIIRIESGRLTELPLPELPLPDSSPAPTTSAPVPATPLTESTALRERTPDAARGAMAASTAHREVAAAMTHGETAAGIAHGETAAGIAHGEPAAGMTHGPVAASAVHGESVLGEMAGEAAAGRAA